MIALIGFAGSGKSTIGKELSALYGFLCHDVDELAEQRSRQTVAAIFEQRGESYFRDMEEELIAELVAGCVGPGTGERRASVLVTGGGAVVRPGTRERLAKNCFVVHVSVPLDVIEKRVSSDTTRPLFQGEDPLAAVRRLYEERRGIYDFASLVVDGRDKKGAAERIHSAWQAWRRSRGFSGA